MENTLLMAWAIPIDTASLGASVEAYVEVKGQITTLQACMRHSSVTRIPNEIWDAIRTELQQLAFDRCSQQWEDDLRCCWADCVQEDHLAKEEGDNLTEEEKKYLQCPWDYNVSEDVKESMDRDIRRHISERHEDVVEGFMLKIGEKRHWTSPKPRFAKYAQV